MTSDCKVYACFLLKSDIDLLFGLKGWFDYRKYSFIVLLSFSLFILRHVFFLENSTCKWIQYYFIILYLSWEKSIQNGSVFVCICIWLRLNWFLYQKFVNSRVRTIQMSVKVALSAILYLFSFTEILIIAYILNIYQMQHLNPRCVISNHITRLSLK